MSDCALPLEIRSMGQPGVAQNEHDRFSNPFWIARNQAAGGPSGPSLPSSTSPGLHKNPGLAVIGPVSTDRHRPPSPVQHTGTGSPDTSTP